MTDIDCKYVFLLIAAAPLLALPAVVGPGFEQSVALYIRQDLKGSA